MLILNRTVWALVLIGVLLAPRPFLSAQSLQQQNIEILNELKAIRQLLEKLAGPLGAGAPAPAPGLAPSAPVSDKVTLAKVTGIVLGKPDAPLTMVEFTDLQCPFCRQFHVAAFEQIKRDYIDTWDEQIFVTSAISPGAFKAPSTGIFGRPASTSRS